MCTPVNAKHQCLRSRELGKGLNCRCTVGTAVAAVGAAVVVSAVTVSAAAIGATDAAAAVAPTS